MKIKKPTTAAAPAAPATGGATIADRFKLDTVQAAPVRTVNKTASLIALIAAVIALGVSAMLTFTLYQHWEFLMQA